jgi:hypothetical protein
VAQQGIRGLGESSQWHGFGGRARARGGGWMDRKEVEEDGPRRDGLGTRQLAAQQEEARRGRRLRPCLVAEFWWDNLLEY